MKFLLMPYLVQKAVLERMGLLELFDFTRLSKRMRIKVKNDVRIRNVELTVFINKVVTFYFVSTKDLECVGLINVEPLESVSREPTHRNIGELNNVSSAFRDYTYGDALIPGMSCYLDDFIQGASTVYKELIGLFSVPAKRGILKLDDFGNEYRSAVNLFNKISPRYIVVYGENVDFQAYMWTLEHLPSSKALNYDVKPIEYLECELSALDHEYVRIIHGFWVRPRHLELMATARSIQVKDSSFTGTNINEFLLRLKSGSNPNLEKSQLLFRGTFEDDDVLNGLNALDIQENGEFFMYQMECANGDSCDFSFTQGDNDGDGIELAMKRTKNGNQ